MVFSTLHSCPFVFLTFPCQFFLFHLSSQYTVFVLVLSCKQSCLPWILHHPAIVVQKIYVSKLIKSCIERLYRLCIGLLCLMDNHTKGITPNSPCTQLSVTVYQLSAFRLSTPLKYSPRGYAPEMR